MCVDEWYYDGEEDNKEAKTLKVTWWPWTACYKKKIKFKVRKKYVKNTKLSLRIEILQIHTYLANALMRAI